MTQRDFAYLYTVAERRGVQYTIGVRADPSLNDVASFAVLLFFQLDDGTRVQVIKIDDSPQDGEQDVHADRYYRAAGADVKDFDLAVETWFDAEEYILEDWERFADQYYQHHGHEPREDGQNV